MVLNEEQPSNQILEGEPHLKKQRPKQNLFAKGDKWGSNHKSTIETRSD
jgi:hypothetical protein